MLGDPVDVWLTDRNSMARLPGLLMAISGIKNYAAYQVARFT
jgi:hypothetical protein